MNGVASRSNCGNDTCVKYNCDSTNVNDCTCMNVILQM